MTLAEFLRRFPDVAVPAETLAFARFLELSGKRFLVHFGLSNCKEAAEAEMNSQLADREDLWV